MIHHSTIKHVAFKHENTGCSMIILARKRKKMFQNMKMYITENKANRKCITEKYFSGKLLDNP